MKVMPVASPAQIKDTSTPEHVRTAKAVEAFNKGQSSYDKTPPQAQEHPVINPNKVSAEELGAIQSKSDKSAIIEPTAATEQPTEVSTAKDPEQEKRFQQIARQERALRAKFQQASQQLKAREAAVKAKEAALQVVQPDLSQYIPKDRLKADPLTYLEEAQVSWDDLTQQAVQRQPTDPRVISTIQKLETKIAELQKQNDQAKLSNEQQQQSQYQAAIKQIKADTKQLVFSDPEFEMVKTQNAVDDVVELIERTYAKDGVVMSVEDAAKEVENYLVEEAMKVTQVEKVKKRLAAAKASPTSTEAKQQTNQKQQPMKTLTNASGGTRRLSVRERAIARAEGFKGDF